MTANEVLALTPAGLYCVPGDFHIDPTRRVARALITHGHSDHARPGHGAVMATRETLAIMALRWGEDFTGARQIAWFGEKTRIGEALVSFYPAGHVLGSGQIAIEVKGLRVVVSGDYKRAADPTCRPFEPIACDLFVTEATFGLPVFRHPEASQEIAKLLASVALFPERAHLVGAYALGKAQRLAALIRAAGWQSPIYVHGALARLMDFYAGEGIPLGEIRRVSGADRATLGGEIVIAPPSALADLWSRKFPDPVTAFASGWMRIRARARQGGITLPLVISDHADWDDLCTTIRDTGCSEVWVTHGEEDALIRWARTRGLDAKPLHLIGYGDEGESDAAPAEGAA